MTEVTEILMDVLRCVSCLQVNRTREVSKRYRKVIEAAGDEHWMTEEVTIGMLKSFTKTISFKRITDYKIDRPVDALPDAMLEPREVAMKVEDWRENPSVGFKARELQVVVLLTQQNHDLRKSDEYLQFGWCDEYCSRDCPTKTDLDEEHLCKLEDFVTVEEVMEVTSHVKADHVEIHTDPSEFSTTLVGRLLQDDGIKAAKSLTIKAVFVNDLTLQWGNAITTDHVASYFRSPGNEERVLFLEDFALTQHFLLRIIQFLTATDTMNFARMLFVEVEGQTPESYYIDHLKGLGNIPLLICPIDDEDSDAVEAAWTFFFKNEHSGETLSLKFGPQNIIMSDDTNEDRQWARFKRLPIPHNVDDLFYDS